MSWYISLVMMKSSNSTQSNERSVTSNGSMQSTWLEPWQPLFHDMTADSLMHISRPIRTNDSRASSRGLQHANQSSHDEDEHASQTRLSSVGLGRSACIYCYTDNFLCFHCLPPAPYIDAACPLPLILYS